MPGLIGASSGLAGNRTQVQPKRGLVAAFPGYLNDRLPVLGRPSNLSNPVKPLERSSTRPILGLRRRCLVIKGLSGTEPSAGYCLLHSPGGGQALRPERPTSLFWGGPFQDHGNQTLKPFKPTPSYRGFGY